MQRAIVESGSEFYVRSTKGRYGVDGYENVDFNVISKIKAATIIGGHDYTLMKEQRRLDVRKYSLSQRTINVRII